jgi:hypothetical protein
VTEIVVCSMIFMALRLRVVRLSGAEQARAAREWQLALVGGCPGRPSSSLSSSSLNKRQRREVV